MVYRGHVENGTVVFDEPVQLPDGTRFVIEFESSGASSEGIHPDIERISGILPEGIDYRAIYHESRRKLQP